MAVLRQCRSALRWQPVGGRRKKTRACPLAFCTFSSCRRLRGVACQNLQKKKRFNGEHKESADFAKKSGAHLSVRASTPGSLCPPRNSREAPPPVEMWEILSATPDWWIAATESPPPTMEVAPVLVAAATALAISRVPLANAGISNTPMGPFQTMVLAAAIFWRKVSMVLGPMSRPIQPSGVAETETVCVGVSGLNSALMT